MIDTYQKDKKTNNLNRHQKKNPKTKTNIEMYGVLLHNYS